MATQTTRIAAAGVSQRLTIVAAVIRWNRGGVGRCADCGSAADGTPRAVIDAYVTRPPEQLVRFSIVAPGTRAESAQVDRWLRSEMDRQMRPRRQSATVSRAICFECAVGMLHAYLGNGGGLLTGALASIFDDAWSAMLMSCEPGHGRQLKHVVCNGRESVPTLAELLKLAPG